MTNDYMMQKTSFLDVPVGALKTQLSKLLLSFDRVGWKKNVSSGRFDPRRTSRLMAGSERVFKKRTEDKAVTTTVCIVVDLSSSMTGRRAMVASQAAWVLGNCIERVGCDVEVVGFKDNVEYGIGNMDAPDGSSKADDFRQRTRTAYYSTGKAVMFKPYHVKMSAARPVFAAMRTFVVGATPDYHVVRTMTERVAESGSDRRLVIVLTDGQGEPALMKKFSRYADETLGTVVLGIGIGTHPRHMVEAYDYFTCISNISELASGSLSAVIKVIKDRDTAVAAGRKPLPPKEADPEFWEKKGW